MENLFDFETYCKDFIKRNLAEREGLEVSMGDLGDDLTYYIRINGTATYSTALARTYLLEWWEESGDYFKYEFDSFGEHLTNPFQWPERYMVAMISEGVRSLLSQCPYIEKRADKTQILTKRIIRKIEAEVEEQGIDWLN